MKDPIQNYIDENRDILDNYHPEKKNWDEIQNKLAQKRKRNGFKLLGAIAATILAIILFNFYPTGSEKEKLSSIVTDSLSTQVDFERKRVEWENKQDFKFNFIRGRTSSDQLSLGEDVLYSISNNYSYTWDTENNTGVTTFNSYTLGIADANGSKTEGSVYPNHTYPYGFFATVQQKEQKGPDDVGHYYEQYDHFKENPFETPLGKPLSTFGIDVDGASYSNIRRFLNGNYLPPKNAVKLEEMVNYFNYDLPQPEDEHPFSITTEVGTCPWQEDNLLLQIALQGEEIEMDENQSNNLVFLVDVSGSMSSSDKLPLLKSSLNLLVDEMDEDDKIAIVVYAGAAGLALPSTSGSEKSTILEAIENLEAGGSTAGGAGIELAYKVAQDEFLKDGNNRIILATDGDFNVGVSDDDSLVELIEKKRESGVFLSVLGFGTGNLQSSKMEKLADNGNGNYFYIDNILEAKKVLVNEIGGTLVTIAKDVKLQLEFNPEVVKSYRLLGYENRILQDKDFDDDTKDSGDLGSGHSVIAFYEIELKETEDKDQEVGGLRYQTRVVNTSKGLKDELTHVKFRYKHPKSKKSKLLEKTVSTEVSSVHSDNFKFASAVVEFGMLLRESKYRGNASFERVLERANQAIGDDKHGYRKEFIDLVEKAQQLFNEYYSEQ